MKKGDDSKHNIYNVNGSFQISCTHIHLKNYDDINILMDKCISTE